jgi:tetratricopeptide (TPR) repeat protein
MDSSSTDFSSKVANHRIRKLLGRAYLRENRIREALEVYLGILKDFPNDVDVLYIIGNLYRLAGNLPAAGRLYQRVLELSPGDRLAEKHAVAREASASTRDAQDVLAGESMETLVEHLQLRNSPSEIEEIRNAAEERVPDLNGHPLEDVQQLMPALIELNIRQARAAGFLDVAEALQSLQINLARHVEDRWADDLLNLDDHPDSGMEEE